MVVLGSDAAVHKAQARSLIGADLDIIVGKDSAVVQSDVSDSQAIPYSLAGGALLDLSVKGVHPLQQQYPLLEFACAYMMAGLACSGVDLTSCMSVLKSQHLCVLTPVTPIVCCVQADESVSMKS